MITFAYTYLLFKSLVINLELLKKYINYKYLKLKNPYNLKFQVKNAPLRSSSILRQRVKKNLSHDRIKD